MKYIDVEKLIAEINKRMGEYDVQQITSEHTDYEQGAQDALYNLKLQLTSLQQEQPKVEVEKFTEKIKTFQGRYKYPEIVSIKGAMAFMARMFYQYPNVARQWYDRLPKTTMD